MGLRAAAAVAAGLTVGVPPMLAGTTAADIPQRALTAYANAAAGAPCPVDWRLLAGLAHVESKHGTIFGGTVGADGVVSPPILGPPLDGSFWQRISDTDDGRYDGDADVDRAVGPFQFIPGTWAAYGAGDPQDIDNAATAAAALLCAAGVDRDRRAAVHTYNQSAAYVAEVLDYADSLPPVTSDQIGGGDPPPAAEQERRLGYAVQAVWDATAVRWWLGFRGVLTPGQVGAWDRVDGWLFGTTPPSSTNPAPRATGLDPTFQAGLERLIAAAPGAITITSGFRTVEEQEQLWQGALAKYGEPEIARRWVAPAEGGSCSSMHCRGLAADLAFATPAVERWAHDNAATHGLQFPLENEPWHIEQEGRR